MCADETRAVFYRHTANLGWLKIPLPACRRLVETFRAVPDTPPSSFRWRYPGSLPSFHQPPGKAQANPEGWAFRQPPRNFHQINNRGARPAQLSSPARAGRRPSSPVGIYSEDPRFKPNLHVCASSALSVLFFWTVHCAAVGGSAAYGCGVPLAGAARLSSA